MLEWGRTTHAGIIAACGPVCAEESSASDTIVNSERKKLERDIMTALIFSFWLDELIVSKACVYVYIVGAPQRPTPAPRIPLPFGSPSYLSTDVHAVGCTDGHGRRCRSDRQTLRRTELYLIHARGRRRREAAF
jgi:hypothetical protein